MHLALEFSDNLRYKEYTHHDGGRGWLPASTDYRREKRRMAKIARRNAEVVVQEYFDVGPDLELEALLQFWVAYIQWVDDVRFTQVMFEFLRPDCSGPGYCHICDGEE